MAKKILWSGSTTLPAPTSLSVNDEIIWTSDTGRTLAGLMVGAVVAQKKNLSIKWEFLTEAQVKTIKNTLVPGFFPFSFRDDGIDITIQSYRGTLSKEHLPANLVHHKEIHNRQAQSREERSQRTRWSTRRKGRTRSSRKRWQRWNKWSRRQDIIFPHKI